MDILPVILLEAGVISLALYAVASLAGARAGLSGWQGLAAGMIAIALFGYAQFWIVFFNVSLALVLPLILAAIVLCGVFEAVRRRSNNDMEILAPCLLVFAASVLLCLWVYAPRQDALMTNGPFRRRDALDLSAPRRQRNAVYLCETVAQRPNSHTILCRLA